MAKSRFARKIELMKNRKTKPEPEIEKNFCISCEEYFCTECKKDMKLP